MKMDRRKCGGTIEGYNEAMDEMAIRESGSIRRVMMAAWGHISYSFMRDARLVACNCHIECGSFGVAKVKTRKPATLIQVAAFAAGLFLLSSAGSCIPFLHCDSLSALANQWSTPAVLAGSIVFRPSAWLRRIAGHLEAAHQLELVERESGLGSGLDKRENDVEITVRLENHAIHPLRKSSGVVTICRPATGTCGAESSLRRGAGRVDSYTARNDHKLPFWVK